MSCPGLHCAGCGAGISVPPAALAWALGAAWVAEHLVEVVIVSAACGVLSAAAVIWLARWTDRRAARLWAQRPVQLRAAPAREVPTAPAPAIGPVVNFNFYGAASPEAARVIRTVIPGTAGDATEGK